MMNEKFYTIRLMTVDGSPYWYSQRGIVYDLDKAHLFESNDSAALVADQFIKLFPSGIYDAKNKRDNTVSIETVEKYTAVRRVDS